MKTKPKQNEVVWYLLFKPDPIADFDVSIHHCYANACTTWKFNVYRTRSEALKAKREIVKILHG